MSDESRTDVHSTDLFVPFLAVEYKKEGPEPHRKGPNQLRICTTAISKFLSHLGITRFPIFGLLTKGTIGLVTCTYTVPLSEDDNSGSAPDQTYKACSIFLRVSLLLLTDM